jgi:phage gp29-like protein
VPRQWAQERLGIPEPEGDEDVLQAPQKTPAPVAEPATKTAAATAQQGALTAADRLDDQLQPVTATWIEQIRHLVENADSLEQIRDGLANLLPGMSIEQYAEGMAQALAAAALQGRLDIIEEAARGR